MPLYDFKCPKCKKQFEEMVNLTEFDREVKCPECGEKAERQLTATPPSHSTWKYWRL